MSLRQLAIAAAVLCTPASIQAGQLAFISTVPPGKSPSISIYEDGASAGSTPIATAVIGEPLELPAGRYQYGFDAFPWRSDGFDVGNRERHEVRLRTFAIAAPKGAAGDFAVFEVESGAPVASVSAGGGLPLPAGSYVMRRDLSDMVEKISVGRGDVTLELGALIVTGETKGEPFALALAGTRQIAAVATPDHLVALNPGRYLVASAEAIGPAPIEITSGQVAEVEVSRIRWSDAMVDGQDLFLRAGDYEIALSGQSGAIQLIGGANGIQLRSVDAEWQDVSGSDGGAPDLLWRLSDGTIANLEGLPLALADRETDRVPRGFTARLRTSLADTADIALTLTQGGATHDLGMVRLGAGNPVFEVAVPDDIAADDPIVFGVRLVAAPEISGVSAEYQVHEQLSVPVAELRVLETTATSVSLSWVIRHPARTLGVRIFRGAETNPATGHEPFRGNRFDDIGLSASRLYEYQVCLVDTMSLPGPCTEVVAKTERP